MEMPRNNYYTAGTLLDYLYHQSFYKLIGIDLSRQTNATILQQINFTEKIEKYDLFIYLFISNLFIVDK